MLNELHSQIRPWFRRHTETARHRWHQIEPTKRRRFIVYPALVAGLAALTGVVVAASIHMPEVADLADLEPKQATEVLDRDGNLIRTFSRENRMMVEEGDLPDLLIHAIEDTEDANFRSHAGVDLQGILRATWVNLKSGRLSEGASTITMQLARDLFALDRSANIWRKIEEAFLAVEIEKRYTKDQILTLYANMVNFGHGNYGVEAAARAYFNKSVSDLSLVEAATLAGIPQNPSKHSVYRRPEAVIARRNLVLRRMLSRQHIDQAAYDAAIEEPLLVAQRSPRRAKVGAYLAEEARRYLLATYGEKDLYDRGLLVETTLDETIQTAAESALRQRLLELDQARGWRGVSSHLKADIDEVSLPSWRSRPLEPGEWFEGIIVEAGRQSARIRHRGQIHELTAKGIRWTGKRRPDEFLKRGDVAWFHFAAATDIVADPAPAQDAPDLLFLAQEPEIEGATLVIESATGAVRAMVGGWDFQRNEFNRATQAKRQVGSAFKLFVFGAAFENGFTAADTLFDGPVMFETGPGQPPYSPRNNSRRYSGVLTLRRALESSTNVPAVKLLDMVGVERVVEFARRCGISSDLPPYPSLALGAASLSALEMAGAYATVANRGLYVEPYWIERVTTRHGRQLEEHQPRAHRAMSAEIAYLLESLFVGVAERGTASRQLSSVPIEVAGKTGTTNGYTDAWFAGFTPRYTMITWIGYDRTRHLGRGMTGGAVALPVFRTLVDRGLEDGWLREGESFQPPPNSIVQADIEPASGLLWTPRAPARLTESFLDGSVPQHRYSPELALTPQLPWYQQQPFYLPKEGEKMPRDVDDWGPIRQAWGGR